MGKLIECKNLSVRLQGKCLYENLNFTVNESDRYIFWGPNGAGKSLLLKLIHLGHNGLLAEKYKGLAVSGQILDKNGRDLINPSAEERKIAYVSQEEIFRKNETVKEMCQMSCYGMGVELDEESTFTSTKVTYYLFIITVLLLLALSIVSTNETLLNFTNQAIYDGLGY